jgi:hypothetical protein
MTSVNANRPIDSANAASLMEAIERYFDLMYDCDTSRFDDVFYPTVHLHGFRDGEMKAWSAETYKDILNARRSPKSQNAPRENNVLLVDFASASQALTKVRVRIASMRFIDYLTWHHVNGKWLITSKGFYLEAE